MGFRREFIILHKENAKKLMFHESDTVFVTL